MTNKTMTSIRLSDRTRAQIDDLIEWGAATSMTDAIEEALRRFWENEKHKETAMNKEDATKIVANIKKEFGHDPHAQVVETTEYRKSTAWNGLPAVEFHTTRVVVWGENGIRTENEYEDRRRDEFWRRQNIEQEKLLD